MVPFLIPLQILTRKTKYSLSAFRIPVRSPVYFVFRVLLLGTVQRALGGHAGFLRPRKMMVL